MGLTVVLTLNNTQVLCIVLTVPPSIVDKETSTDMVVREGANVTLTCKATGYPEPYVMWRREDGKDINYNGESGNYTHTHANTFTVVHVVNSSICVFI